MNMTSEMALVFTLTGCVCVALVWERLRSDLIALLSMAALLLLAWPAGPVQVHSNASGIWCSSLWMRTGNALEE